MIILQVKAEDSKERKEDPEKEARTVFVGNLPVSCKKQDLKKIFADFGKIEAIRFRCAARPDLKTTKKVRRLFWGSSKPKLLPDSSSIQTISSPNESLSSPTNHRWR